MSSASPDWSLESIYKTPQFLRDKLNEYIPHTPFTKDESGYEGGGGELAAQLLKRDPNDSAFDLISPLHFNVPGASAGTHLARNAVKDIGDIAERRLGMGNRSLTGDFSDEAKDFLHVVGESVPDDKVLDKFLVRGKQADYQKIHDLVNATHEPLELRQADIADHIHQVTESRPPARTVPRRAGTPTINKPILRPDKPTMASVAGGNLIDLGRGHLQNEGASPKTIGEVEGQLGKQYLIKGTPWSGTNVFGGDAINLAEEESASKLLHLLTGGKAPIAQQVAEGGTIQEMLGPEFVQWDKLRPSQLPGLLNEDMANQVMHQHYGDTLGRVIDRGERQFMVNPQANDLRGVDKGFAEDLRDYRRSSILDPSDITNAGGGLRDMYSHLTTTGGQGMFHQYADPRKYQEYAQAAKNIPDAAYHDVMEPYLQSSGFNDADKREYMRNFLQAIQDSPQTFDIFSRTHMR